VTTSPKEADPFTPLLDFLERLPAIDLPAGRKSIGSGTVENGNWWVKFRLKHEHPLAWRHVQELGFVLNYFSLEKRLPTAGVPSTIPEWWRGILVVGY
jgi:hypothetical protein